MKLYDIMNLETMDSSLKDTVTLISQNFCMTFISIEIINFGISLSIIFWMYLIGTIQRIAN